jgi:SAM-dependent methyltransferase
MILTALRVLDLPRRALRRAVGERRDYRHHLFEELRETARPAAGLRILEIGPKDGEDTRRLLSLEPGELVLVDLPDKADALKASLAAIPDPRIELVIGNLMYDAELTGLAPFDIVWCTGVLYHNPEQLRFVRRLFDLTRPEGWLVLESATARRAPASAEAFVEIWHRRSDAEMRRMRLAHNVTHLPSRAAVAAWLHMVGFTDIAPCGAHGKVSFALPLARAAFLARRPAGEAGETYYAAQGLHYPIGRAL